jgi:hypothetical protein
MRSKVVLAALVASSGFVVGAEAGSIERRPVEHYFWQVGSSSMPPVMLSGDGSIVFFRAAPFDGDPFGSPNGLWNTYQWQPGVNSGGLLHSGYAVLATNPTGQITSGFNMEAGDPFGWGYDYFTAHRALIRDGGGFTDLTAILRPPEDLIGHSDAATAISDDGSVAIVLGSFAGFTQNSLPAPKFGGSGLSASRWTTAGFQQLQDQFGNPPLSISVQTVAAGGEVAVGSLLSLDPVTLDFVSPLARWFGDSPVAVPLPPFPPGYDFVRATGADSAAEKIVGLAVDQTTNRIDGWYWSAEGGYQILQRGGREHCISVAISGDGSVLVGTLEDGVTFDNMFVPLTECDGVWWPSPSSAPLLISGSLLPAQLHDPSYGTVRLLTADSVSRDGTKVAGLWSPPLNPENFRWDLPVGPYVASGFTSLPCRADLNDDGFVDDSDFVYFAASYDLYLCDAPSMPLECAADITDDGVVDDLDFVLFATAYDLYVCP